jgi:hypothetical protein
MRLRPSKAYILLALLAVGIIAAGFAVSSDCTSTSADKVRPRIEKELPTGTQREAILRWLDDNSIRLLSEGTANQYSALSNAGAASTTRVIFASINAGRTGLFTERDVDIYFLLDSEGKLARVVVEDVKRGL